MLCLEARSTPEHRRFVSANVKRVQFHTYLHYLVPPQYRREHLHMLRAKMAMAVSGGDSGDGGGGDGQHAQQHGEELWHRVQAQPCETFSLNSSGSIVNRVLPVVTATPHGRNSSSSNNNKNNNNNNSSSSTVQQPYPAWQAEEQEQQGEQGEQQQLTATARVGYSVAVGFRNPHKKAGERKASVFFTDAAPMFYSAGATLHLRPGGPLHTRRLLLALGAMRGGGDVVASDSDSIGDSSAHHRLSPSASATAALALQTWAVQEAVLHYHLPSNAVPASFLMTLDEHPPLPPVAAVAAPMAAPPDPTGAPSSSTTSSTTTTAGDCLLYTSPSPRDRG